MLLRIFFSGNFFIAKSTQVALLGTRSMIIIRRNIRKVKLKVSLMRAFGVLPKTKS